MRGQGAVRAAVLVGLAGALYANSLGNAFVWDDRLTAATSAGGVFGRTGGYFRPVVMLSFALDRGLWGSSPVGFHVTNVLCHAAVAWLLAALAIALGGGAGVALAAAVVFVAHPVQTEAVTYISGRTDLLCALFLLVSLLLWRRARHPADRFAVGSAAALIVALLAKETAVAAPLALLVPGAHPDERPPRPVLPFVATGAWLAAWTASGGPGLHLRDLVGRLPAIAVAALGYLRILVWPADLHLERFTSVPGWSVATALSAWLTLGVLAAALLWLARRLPGGLFLLALAALTYAPGSGVVPVYPAIAERALFTPEHFLYLPLLGLAPLAVSGLAAVWPVRAGRAAPAVLAVVVLAWGGVVVARNRDWRDEETLFRHTVAHDPPAGRVWFNLGNLELAAGRLDEAARLYEAALARDPHDGDAHLNLGIVRQRQGHRAEAEEQYRQAIASAPHLAEAYRALAALLAAQGEAAEAAALWQQGQRGGRQTAP